VQYTEEDLRYIEYVETHGFIIPSMDDTDYWFEESKKLSMESNKPGYWSDGVHKEEEP
jgi:hypothetical protein